MNLVNRLAQLERRRTSAESADQRYGEYLRARYEERLAAADGFLQAVPTDELLGELLDDLGGPGRLAEQVAADEFPADDAPAVAKLFFQVIDPHGPARYPTPMPAEWLRLWLDHPEAEVVGKSSTCGWCGCQLPYLRDVGTRGGPGYYQCRPVRWHFYPCCRPDDPPPEVAPPSGPPRVPHSRR